MVLWQKIKNKIFSFCLQYGLSIFVPSMPDKPSRLRADWNNHQNSIKLNQ